MERLFLTKKVVLSIDEPFNDVENAFRKKELGS